MSAQTRSVPIPPGKIYVALPKPQPKQPPSTDPPIIPYESQPTPVTHPSTVPTDDPAQPSSESTEPMQISAPSDDFLFPRIEPNPHQDYCLFCRHQLSGPRCLQCSKVNYSRMEFNRERFLSSKWECLTCHFRNVHSNQKCIECNNPRYRLPYR